MTTRLANAYDLQTLFDAQRDRFLVVVRNLTVCDACADRLLAEARAQAETARISAGFEYIFTIRVLVQLAIAHVQACPSFGDTANEQILISDGRSESALRLLPWAERTAFFIRDVLGYSRRDCSLLMGISDLNADRMLAFARKRIESLFSTRADFLSAWYQQAVLEYDPAPCS